MTISRTSSALVVASALLLLAGCSGGSTAPEAEATRTVAPTSAPAEEEAAASEGGQSKAEACQILGTTFTELGTMGGELDMSDPQGTVTAFSDFADRMRIDLAEITNAEIAPAAQQAAAGMDEYAAYLESMLTDPSKAGELTDRVTAMQEDVMQAATACQG